MYCMHCIAWRMVESHGRVGLYTCCSCLEMPCSVAVSCVTVGSLEVQRPKAPEQSSTLLQEICKASDRTFNNVATNLKQTHPRKFFTLTSDESPLEVLSVPPTFIYSVNIEWDSGAFNGTLPPR